MPDATAAPSVHLVAAARTPIGRLGGALAATPAVTLGAAAIAAALERSGLPGTAVDEVVMGQVLRAGTGQATARRAALAAGDRRHVAETVGIGAIKYADLSQNRTTDYVFSFDKMLQLTGNTAAYMQYAVARVEGIFAKGGIDRDALRVAATEVRIAEPAERALALDLLRFGEVLEDVEADYRPNLLTTWLYDLAGRYSSFYDTHPVLKAEGPERASRLALCDLTGRVLRTGLELLGIGTVERM